MVMRGKRTDLLAGETTQQTDEIIQIPFGAMLSPLMCLLRLQGSPLYHHHHPCRLYSSIIMYCGSWRMCYCEPRAATCSHKSLKLPPNVRIEIESEALNRLNTQPRGGGRGMVRRWMEL